MALKTDPDELARNARVAVYAVAIADRLGWPLRELILLRSAAEGAEPRNQQHQELLRLVREFDHLVRPEGRSLAVGEDEAMICLSRAAVDSAQADYLKALDKVRGLIRPLDA